jgi:uncharacterized protein YcaQ
MDSVRRGFRKVEESMRFSRGRRARSLLLAAQGLNPRLDRSAEKADVLEAVRRMGVLQIDSISVVARSPYLVLWSRLGHYEPGWRTSSWRKERSLSTGRTAACFLPIEDYGLYRRGMLDGREEDATWMRAHPRR